MERFRGVSFFYRDAIREMYNHLLDMWPQPFRDTIIEVAFEVAPHLRNLHPEHVEEIEGIGNVLELPWQVLTLFNYIYEFGAHCTSIIARHEDGTIMHGRNLDFFFGPILRKMVYQGNFYKDGKQVFQSAMFGGVVAPFTAFKKGTYSISQNTRTTSENGFVGFALNVVNTFLGYQKPDSLIRETFLQCPDYECAVKHLKEA